MRRIYVLLASLSIMACTPDGKPAIYTNRVAGEIGGPCSVDTDCHGSGGTCMTTHFAGSTVGAPDGYCTRTCGADSDCGSGKCIQDFDDNKFYCMAFCEGPSNCRADYVCLTEKHCEPFARYPLSCDPKDSSGFCTTQAGKPGGCIRWAFGTGSAGICFPSCLSATDCSSGSGCYLLKETSDPFEGTICFGNAGKVTTGGSCMYNSDCVSFNECVLPDNTCKQLCNDPGGTCTNGLTCYHFKDDFSPTGYCDI